MKRQTVLFQLSTLLVLLLTFQSKACGVDVTVLEGNSIEICQFTNQSINASSGYVSYTWYGVQNGSGSSIIPQNSGWYYVDAEDNVGCISTDSIEVTILPTPNPVISSSEGPILCPGSTGTILSLSQTYNGYSWSTGQTDPAILVSQEGTYSVLVTDANGCQGTSAITINSPNFSLNAIGGTNFVCEGSTITLEATGGDAYSWSTGEFGSTIAVAPDSNTTYSVTIFKGSCQQTLSQLITVLQIEDYYLPDTIFIKKGDETFVAGPTGFDQYSWTPIDDLTVPNAAGTSFIGEETTLLTLEASSGSGCALTDSVLIYVMDVTIPEGFSPNNDTHNDFFVIPELDSFTGGLTVWNRWGDVVLKEELYQNDWDGKCETSFCLGKEDLPEGTYFYLLEIVGLKFDGFLTLKR